MKKFSLCFMLMFGFVFLSACSSDSAVEEEINAKEDKTTINWLQHWSTEVGMENVNKVKEAFEKENPDIELNIEEIPFPQLHDKLIALHLSGNPPDVLHMAGAWVTEFADAGIVDPIDDYLEQTSKEYQENLEGPMSVPWKGSRYGIPITNGNMALFYNKKLLNEANVSPPKNWDELVEASKKLTIPEKNQFALTGNLEVEPPTAITYEILPLIIQAGGKILEDGKAAFNSKEGVEALNFYKDLIKVHKVTTPGELSAGEKEKRSNFSAENTAFMVEGPWGVGIQKSANPELEFGVVPLPKGKQFGSLAIGSQIGIAAHSDKKEATWKFLEFMGSAEGQRIWSQATGYFPYNQETMKMDYVMEDEYLSVFAQQFEDADVEVIDNYIPEAENLRKALTNEIQKFLEGEKTAEEALEDAAIIWNEKIDSTQ